MQAGVRSEVNGSTQYCIQILFPLTFVNGLDMQTISRLESQHNDNRIFNTLTPYRLKEYLCNINLDFVRFAKSFTLVKSISKNMPIAKNLVQSW